MSDLGKARMAIGACAALTGCAVILGWASARDWAALLGLLALLCALAAAFWLRPRPRKPAMEAMPPVAQAQMRDLVPLLEALPEPALVIDREGRIAGSNAAVRKQLEFEASGLRLSAILRHPELLDGAQAAAEDGRGSTVEYQPAGSLEEHFRVYFSPLVWGGQTAALMVFHDQTSRVATERMRSDFLANASHELRTPVATLSLLLETLSGPAREDAEASAKFMGLMANQVDRMRRLVDDLLALSRIELNEHVPPVGEIGLDGAAKEAVDALTLVARERGVALELCVSGIDPLVKGEHFQLQQVLQNLIDNAIKYSPAQEGKVRVEIGIAKGREQALDLAGRRWPDAGRIALLMPPPGAGEQFAYVRVSDNGRGIARRYLPRLTERFYRVDPDSRSEKIGTGLGLAIVKHIMNRHRGGFCVESVVGQGSAFAIYLPRV